MIPLVELVAGARPNFMKLAPVLKALTQQNRVGVRIVHTGQHYDATMSDVFFTELGIPPPDVHLEVGSGSHGAQTARILERYELHLLKNRPDGLVVFGDVNSTVGCALAAVKLGVKVAHVEAGLRSFDRTMPEEINRLLTDAIADLLLVTEPSGVDNLKREGVSESKIRLVGNVMIDTLLENLPKTRNVASRFGIPKGAYGFVTLHRPSNVDDPEVLRRLIELFHGLSEQLPLVFAIHPRTLRAAGRAGIEDRLAAGQGRLVCLGPQPYLDALALASQASVILTDSGGLQEESSVLGVPCLTLRENTERPVTVSMGTSRLVGNHPARIRSAFDDVLRKRWRPKRTIPLWDGHAGPRVAREIACWI